MLKEHNAFVEEFGELFGPSPLAGLTKEQANSITKTLAEAEDPDKEIEVKAVIESRDTAYDAIEHFIEATIETLEAYHPDLEVEENIPSLLALTLLAGMDLGRLNPEWAKTIRRHTLSEESLELNDKSLTFMLQAFPLKRGADG